jgi:hypothetical protein
MTSARADDAVTHVEKAACACDGYFFLAPFDRKVFFNVIQILDFFS